MSNPDFDSSSSVSSYYSAIISSGAALSAAKSKPNVAEDNVSLASDMNEMHMHECVGSGCYMESNIVGFECWARERERESLKQAVLGLAKASSANPIRSKDHC